MSINFTDCNGEKIIIYNGEKIKYYQSAIIEVKIDDPKLYLLNGSKQGGLYLLDSRFFYGQIQHCNLNKSKDETFVNIQADMTSVLGIDLCGFIMQLKIFLKSKQHNKELNHYIQYKFKQFWSQDTRKLDWYLPTDDHQYTGNIIYASSKINYYIKRKIYEKVFFNKYKCLLDETPKVQEILVYDKPRKICSIYTQFLFDYRKSDQHALVISKNEESKLSFIEEQLKFKKTRYQQNFIHFNHDIMKQMLQNFF